MKQKNWWFYVISSQVHKLKRDGDGDRDGRWILMRAILRKSWFLTKYADCFLDFLMAVAIFFSFFFIQFISFNFCVRFFFLVFRDCFTCPVTRKPHILFKFNFTQGMTEFTTRYGKKPKRKKKPFILFSFFCMCKKMRLYPNVAQHRKITTYWIKWKINWCRKFAI